MGYESVFSRQELFVAAATVAAHSNAKDGFRQRDVRFLVDLFVNWVESALQRSSVNLQNTQIQRYLDGLTQEGFARRISRGAHPLYRLTRTGLLELLSRMVEKPQLASGMHFFFLFYFIRNYASRLEQLVHLEGKQFPYALKIELERLLDVRGLVERELQYARKELKKLEQRIDDARKTSELVVSSLKRGIELSQIVQEAEKRYPYELNSQKPLSELISLIPENYRRWELETGNLCRIQDMWLPELGLLKNYIEQLERAKITLSQRAQGEERN